MTHTRIAQISIDTEALRHNLQRVKIFAPNSKVIAVIKANAYGHGVQSVANALSEAAVPRGQEPGLRSGP